MINPIELRALQAGAERLKAITATVKRAVEITHTQLRALLRTKREAS